jgi:cytochrome P450
MKSDTYMTKEEVVGNSWILLVAGHETTGNTLHYALLYLAMNLSAQRHLQADIDEITGSRNSSEWTYAVDMGRLYNSMVGAVQNEVLRLAPPIIDIPKIVDSPQQVKFDGKTVTIPAKTFIHMSAVGIHYNPRYWPTSPSKISNKPRDLDDFVPERWLLAPASTTQATKDEEVFDGLESVSFERGTKLYIPPKGSFLAFSDGPRGCPGKRFAQVEITAVLAVIFQKYTVEYDVRKWASDEEVLKMGIEEKKRVYKLACENSRRLIQQSEIVLTLKMVGESVPVRLVERGRERFKGC